MATLFQLPRVAPVSAGSSYASAKAYFYQPGTTTAITTYTTAALSTPHDSPVVADANGVFAPIFLKEAVNATYRLQLYTSADVLIYDVDNLPALTAATNDYRYRITAAETAAGLTTANLTFGYDPGDVRRYGNNATPGTTDMTTPIQNAINAAAQGGWGVYGFTEGEAYSTGNITLYGASTSIPQFFNGGQAKFIALPGTTGYLFDIQTPQSGSSHGFRFENAIIDGNDICVPLRIYGSQRAVYGNLLLQNSSGAGLYFEHESGGNGGIYYNLFYNILSGASGNTNAGAGFYSDANSGPSNTMQDNTFINCQAQFNLGHGWDLQYGSGLWAGCGAEKNNGYGYLLTNMVEATFTGGFTENNHKGMAGGGASDGTTDISFYIATGCNGVKVLGGRHIGEVNGTDMFAIGNFFLPGNFVQMPNLILDERERLRIRSLLPTARSFTISSIAKGATTTITTSVNHNLQTDDIVRFAFSVADDWQTYMDDMSTAVTVTGEKTFTVAVNSSGYVDYTSGGTCKNGAGIAFDGATPPQGGINGAAGWEIQAVGSQVMTFHATCASDETGIYLRHNAGGGGTVVERVTVGAVDSGGSGYRVLRIPN